MEKDRCAGLVLAAGQGTRLGLGPKAFLKLGDMTLVERIIRTLTTVVDRILVGVPPEKLEEAKHELSGLAEIYPGGTSRASTAQILLQQCTEEFVLIQDAVNPFASAELCRSALKGAARYGAAVTVGSIHLPVGVCEGTFLLKILPRSGMVTVQTPHGYRRKILEEVFQRVAWIGDIESIPGAVLTVLPQIAVIPNEMTNIKITTPFDWEVAERVVAPLFDYKKNISIRP